MIPEHLILTCKDTTALLSKSFDTDLPIAERTQARLHLTFCSACKRYSKQLQFLHDVLHDEPSELPPLREKARQRLQEEIISAM